MAQPTDPNPQPAALVAARLAEACSHSSHAFWPEPFSLLQEVLIRWERLLGPRQITEASLLALAAGSAASATPLTCSTATLKGTYLYSESGVLNGNPYAESGREVYDGKGGIVLSYRGSDGSGGALKAASFISPDGNRFVYTITAAPGRQPTALSGSELRVAP